MVYCKKLDTTLVILRAGLFFLLATSVNLYAFNCPDSLKIFWSSIENLSSKAIGHKNDKNRIKILPKRLLKRGYWEEAELKESPYGDEENTKAAFDKIYQLVESQIFSLKSVRTKGHPFNKEEDARKLNMESLHIVVKFYEKDLGSGSVEKNVSSVEFYVGNQDSATIYRASPEMIEFLQPAIKMLQAKREEVVNSFAGSRGIKRGVYQGSFFLDRGRIDSDFHDHREEAHLVSNIQLGTSRGTEFSDGYVTHRNKWVHFGPYERHRAAPQVVEDGGWRWVAVVFHLK